MPDHDTTSTLFRRLTRRLPLQFRVLYRHFVLNVIDLESVSIHADIPRYLAQFGGILFFFSLILALGAIWPSAQGALPEPARLQHTWHIEQLLISINLLVVALVTIFTWDSIFPDRRDALVLSPLPLKPHTILFARTAASASVVGLAVLALNCASVVAWSLVLGGFPGVLRLAPALWLGILASSAFVYCAVLTFQGLTALLLPRRLFLRILAMAQVVAFGLAMGSYFLLPYIDTPAALTDPGNHSTLAFSPLFWFFALANQVNGTLPPHSAWLARRGWIALAAVIACAMASFALSYLRTMRKTIEQPDLLPNRRAIHWPAIGGSLNGLILQFVWRALARSRHHRVILAFYLSIVLAICLGMIRALPPTGLTAPVSPAVPAPTVLMLALTVLGFRSVFSIPVSLNANWVLRITQLRSSEKYIAATRRTLFILSVVPICAVTALLSLRYRPWPQAAFHLVILALMGMLMLELSLIGFFKVPFTCSYMPGKANFQLVFWGCFAGLILLLIFVMAVETPALETPLRATLLILFLACSAGALWRFNRQRTRTVEIYFEEQPEVIITTLGIAGIHAAINCANSSSGS